MDEPQKLFSLPGTIEEEEEERKFEDHRQLSENLLQHDSPYVTHKISGNTSNIPRNITLVRVSTQSSSIGGVGRQDSYRSRYRSGPVRKIRRRAVLKNGECNVLQSKISRRSLRFLQDIFTTLVDTQWRWTLLCFSLSFVLSWLGYAVIWWLIAFTHGDFEEKHLPPYQIENNWTPCVYNIFSFTSCFLFSIETQHTIGYGSRSTSEECPEAIFVMCMQSISGVMIQAFMVGIVFAKMSRPKQRTQTLLFSKNAVVCQRDGELCFMFRVADMRKSHIIGANVRAQIIRSKTTKEGEILSQYQEELNVGTDGDNGNIFFIWPMTIIHKINSNSPFYNMSAEDMLTERFEVVVILEGTIESTGQTTQARSSYLPQEILWGHRFEPMVCYSKERQGYEVDHSLFNSTTQVDTPLCSGRELAEFYRAQDHTTGFITDDDEISEDPYHDINHQYFHTNQHRSTTGYIDSVIQADSFKSDNSLNENCNYINKDNNDYKIHQQRNINNNQCKLNEFNDRIEVVGEVDIKNLSEAVNKEIVKNCKDIFDNNYELLWRDEDKQSLIGSKRNLANLNDDKRINSSKRQFNNNNNNSNYKKYILLSLGVKNDDLSGSNRKLTGSKEYLYKQQIINNERDSKKLYVEMNKKKKLGESVCDEEHDNLMSSQIESEDKKLPKLIHCSNNSTCVQNKSITSTSEFSAGDDNTNLHLTEPNNLLILRNRKSYENAQLQDVNKNPTDNFQINNNNNSIPQVISYTTV